MIKEIELSYSDPQLDIFFDWPEGVRFKGVQKGRRFGATKGAANAIIEWALEGISPILWGDTIHGNIDRYVERYFVPELKYNQIGYSFDKVAKKMVIGNSFIDFRSADNPQNWEGFGYKMIFLNEAGIILKDRYLYTNAVLPMLMDFPDSRLIAAGVPKGKMLKDGSEHPFYTICKKKDNPAYKIHKYSSYDNPLLDDEDVKALEKEIGDMSPEMVDQEIYGEFIDSKAINPFFYAYSEEKHCSEVAIYDPNKQLYLGIDFNLNPFGCIFFHLFVDKEGQHMHVFDELSIPNGSIHSMIEQIKAKYGNNTRTLLVTGDAMGNRGELGQRDNASLYIQLQRGLNLSSAQIKAKSNPTHENSRADCNFFLHNFKDFKLNPKTCPNLKRDMSGVNCDAFGTIIKKNRKDVNQLADHADCLRYSINEFLKEWIMKTRIK